MPVLIDGNNLLFAARAIENPDILFGKAMLCEALGAWSLRTGQAVHVVFDGAAPSSQRAEQIGNVAIEMTFSGSGVSADAVLTKMVEADSAARRMLVVSTDREIQQAARGRRAQVMRSDEFWRTLRRDLAKPRRQAPSEPKGKRHGLNSAETDEWLREFGVEDSNTES